MVYSHVIHGPIQTMLARFQNVLNSNVKCSKKHTSLSCHTLTHQDLQSHDGPTHFTCVSIQIKYHRVRSLQCTLENVYN